MLLKFHLTNPYSVAFVVFFVNSILFLLYSIEFLWYRLSMKLSLVVLWLSYHSIFPFNCLVPHVWKLGGTFYVIVL